MNRHISHLLLLAVLLNASVALAQVGAVPPPPPEPMPVGATAPPAAQPALPPTAPPTESAWPPPGQFLMQPATPYSPPDQPAYSPQPMMVAPAQPAYVLPAPYGPPPSPSLGLIPGESNPHWDIGLDVLWLDRSPGSSVPLGFTNYNYASHASQRIDTYSMWSDDVLFPLAPGLRLQLVGRITDRMAVETICWGLQQWSVGEAIYGDPATASVLAYSRWLQTSDLLYGLDNSLSYTYNSQVANVEINQRFKFLSYDPYRACSWLWGVRYFYLSDDFTLNGSDLYPAASESLNWKTKNNLLGVQLGLQGVWGWDRFQLSSEIKGGLYANIYSQHGTDSAQGAAGFQPFDESHSATDLAAIFEVSLMLRYRVTTNLWVRGGYQYYCATGLALGPRQLGGYDSNGTVGMDGLSLGLDWTW